MTGRDKSGDSNALRDIDVGRFERTQARAREYAARYGGSESSFFTAPEHTNSPEQFLSQVEYNRALKNQAAPVQEGIGGMATFGSGKSNVIGYDSRTFANGQFANAGEFLTSTKDKQEFAKEAIKQIDTEMVKLEANSARTQAEDNRLENLKRSKARLSDPEELRNLQIVNRARTGYSDRHVIAHERTHAKLDEIDPTRKLRADMQKQLTAQEQASITQQMRKKMNNAEMSNEEAFEEYLTEGMANAYKSWAEEAPDAVQLTPAHLQQLQQQATASGKPAFAVSGSTPELEEVERSGGAFVSAMQARGYQMAGALTKAFQQAGQFTATAIEPAVRVAEGVAGRVQGVVQAVSTRARDIAGAAQLGALAGKRTTAEQAQGAAVGTVQTYDTLRANADNLAREERKQRTLAQNLDQEYRRDQEKLVADRAAAIKRGDVAETNRLSPQISNIERDRAELKRTMESITKERIEAEQKAEKARGKVASSVGTAEEKRGAYEEAKAAAGIRAPRAAAPVTVPTPAAPTTVVPPATVPPPPQPAPTATGTVTPRSSTTTTPRPEFTEPTETPSPTRTEERAPEVGAPARSSEPVQVKVEPIPAEVLRGLAQSSEGLRSAAAELNRASAALQPGIARTPESIKPVTDGLKLMYEEMRKQRERGGSPLELQELGRIRGELDEVEGRLRMPEQSPAETQLLRKQLQNLTNTLRGEPLV